MQSPARADLAQAFLLVLTISLLIGGCLWTLLPFLGALLWATTIVVATWPLLLRAERWLGGRRSLATALMLVLMLGIFIVPLAMATGTLLEGLQEGTQIVKRALTHGVNPPPDWVAQVPWVGTRLDEYWRELAAGGPDELADRLRPYMSSAASWALAVTGGVGLVMMHFLLTVVIAGILYAQGEKAAMGVVLFARRVGGERGERAVRLAGQAVRGVAMGVVVTAVVQSAIAGIGLWLAGVPRTDLLIAAIFILCVAQLGPVPVLAPAVIWLYWSGDVVWGTVLLVITCFVAVVDNFLKPLLIRKGVDLPLLLIVAGVIGGLIGFGVVGLFLGPVVLAVTFTMSQAWVQEGPATMPIATGSAATLPPVALPADS
jgi:predicted PurR-regulated permease PerM